MALPSVQEMEAYIRAKAAELGIDPDIAVRVARSEGLKPNTWQAEGNLAYGRERSYGPYQLHVAPHGYRQGMGNDFVKATGLDPADPSTWRQGVDFALDRARSGGWGPWFGAKSIGVTGKMGIGGQPSTAPIARQEGPPAPEQPGSGTSMGGYAEGPQAVADRMPNGGLLDPDQDPVMGGPDAGFDYDNLAALGELLSKYGKSSEEDRPSSLPPPPPVLQPLRRITLGKGLLG